jgi:hypothetical protein
MPDTWRHILIRLDFIAGIAWLVLLFWLQGTGRVRARRGRFWLALPLLLPLAGGKAGTHLFACSPIL